MSTAKIGKFSDLIQITEKPLQSILNRLREIILEIHPDACEVVRLGERAATYGLGPKKMSEGYAYLLPHKAWINLGFFRGTDLDDPDKMLEGTGAKMRHVKIRSIGEADQPSIRSLIKSALEERTRALRT